MKTNILKKMRIVLMLTIVSFAFSVFAQDINQAGDIFNEANKLVKEGKYEEAIPKYEESMGIASQLGENGEQIVNGAKGQIPSLYYKLGATDYKAKKIDKAIGEFEKAIEFGEKFGDKETVKKSKEIIPKLYYARGNSLYKEKKYEEALASFQKSFELNPKYSRALFGMGLVYNKLEKISDMEESFKAALEISEAENDQRMIDKINKTARKLLQAKGASDLQAKKYDNAIKYLNASLAYDPSNTGTHYYLAIAYNGVSNWDETIKVAKKGLEFMKDESNEEKAKLYYELGNAHKGKGQKDEACKAYKNANYGKFAESATYELKTVLKCK